MSAVTRARVLIAGIGNIFQADDGFGVAVAQALKRRGLPEQVRLTDAGIRGVHLAFELMDGGYETAILVDAMPRGGAPGTLYVIEPDAGGGPGLDPIDAHGLTPDAVLSWLQRLDGPKPRVLIVGCEPASVEEGMGLSPAVAAVVDDAADLALDLARRTLGHQAGSHERASAADLAVGLNWEEKPPPVATRDFNVPRSQTQDQRPKTKDQSPQRRAQSPEPKAQSPAPSLPSADS